jgi:uncharacterized protein (DUF433 family)
MRQVHWCSLTLQLPDLHLDVIGVALCCGLEVSMNARSRVVTSFDEVEDNIRTYMESVAKHPELAARIKQHPAWYGIRGESGDWMFGPSKFIGYREAGAANYLSNYDRRDGKETEPVLSAWFEQVDGGTALGRELRDAFISFAEAFGKSPNVRWRVSVPKEYLNVRSGRDNAELARERIAFDPGICGGRPHIRGTRIRVSDIITALASGDSVDELLADFPYLSAEDISAALHYAAGAVDHRVLVAA